MFQWNSDMAIDQGFIDEDHKKLIEIANRVEKLSHPNRDAEELKQAIRELYDYTKYHFVREEELMDEIKYPDAKEHNQKHGAIVKEMNHFLTSSQHMKEMLENFQKLVNKWVFHHIMAEDGKLRDFLEAQKSTR